MSERYALLGLARPRSEWLSRVTTWAMSESLGADFVKCLGRDELQLRLELEPLVSAVLADAASGLDRDLIDLARRRNAAVFVIDADPSRDWFDLGATAILPPEFDLGLLLDRLEAHAPAIRPLPGAASATRSETPRTDRYRGTLIAVGGAPGGGASTVAMSLGAGLARHAQYRGNVVVADLALPGMQAAYHDVGDVVPALPELVDAHRHGNPGRTGVTGATFPISSRGYDLLLGTRRRREWTALPTRATEAAIDSLRGTYRWVIADVTLELDGEDRTGSLDLEERNHLARCACTHASVVAVVTTADLRGMRWMGELWDELAALGVDPGRVLPILNRCPRSPAARSEAVAALTEVSPGAMPPLLLPHRRDLESIHRCVDPLPRPLTDPLAAAVIGADTHTLTLTRAS